MATTKSGHTLEYSSEEETKEYQKYFPTYKHGYMRMQPGGWFFSPQMKHFADKIYDFQFKPTDVMVMTYPKCGTTWTQEIVWTMTNDINFDNPLYSMPLMYRSPFIELDGMFDPDSPTTEQDIELLNKVMEQFNRICPGKDPKNGIILQMAEHMPEPRIIKTHLAFSLFNPKLLDTCKVIYVARNPKDACISYYHHHKLIRNLQFEGGIDEFVDFYIKDELLHSPFWEHVKEGWEKRNHSNLHWIFFEDMKKDPKQEILRLNTFLGTNLPGTKLDEILQFTKFENMKERDPMFGAFQSGEKQNVMYNKKHKDEVGNFFRKGLVGDWINSINEEQNKKLNDWINEKSKDIDIEFTY